MSRAQPMCVRRLRFERTFLRLSRSALLGAVATTLLSSVASAEGTEQLNTTQALRAGTNLFVDVFAPNTETISWTGSGVVTVSAPDGTEVAVLSSGQSTPSLSPYGVGAYRVVPSNNQVVFQAWDISVENATSSGGRLHSYDWAFNAGSFAESRATNASFYAIVSGGVAGQSSVIELHLDGLAGYVYNINANRRGVDGTNAGRSVPMSGNSVTPEFPMYLNPPDASTYAGSSPQVSDLSFVGGVSVDADGESIPACNKIVPGGTGLFQFNTNTEGTYHVQCDLNEDGDFRMDDDSDLLLVGETAVGLNTVTWDGHHNGEPVAHGQYNCRVRVNVGEFHYVGSDIETSYPGLRLYEVHADGERSPLTMFFNDTAVQGNAQQMPNGATSLESSGAEGLFPMDYSSSPLPNVNSRSWGNWNSVGKGNTSFLDTCTWLASSVSATITVEVVDPSIDTDGDGAGDFEEECAFGTDPLNPDSNGDGIPDGEEYGGGATSGGGNGLESNGRLAARLARRAIQRSRLTPGPVVGHRAATLLEQLAPPAGILGVDSADSTPGDLVDLTSASDVFARDYFDENGHRVGGILILQTVGGTYEHSKVVCDRSQGAVLDDIVVSRIGEHDVLRAKLVRDGGRFVDRMAAFSIHESDTEDTSALFSYWLTSEYPEVKPDARATRVQVWSSMPGGETLLAREVLGRAESRHGALAKPGDEQLLSDEALDRGDTLPEAAPQAHVPSHYFSQGRKLGNTLSLTLAAPSGASVETLSLRLVGLADDALSEETLEFPLHAETGAAEIELDVGSVLDVTVELVANGEIQDRLWLSDGAWAAYDDSLWGGTTHTSFSRSDCTPRTSFGEFELSGCAGITADVQGDTAFAGVARHLARPLALAGYRSLSAYVESDRDLRLCAQTTEGAVHCRDIGTVQGYVDLALSDLLNDEGIGLSEADALSLLTFTSEEPGEVSMEVSGLSLSSVEVPTAANDDEASGGGCSVSTSGQRPLAAWLAFLALLGVRRRRQSRRA
ncbi:MAG: thrombospondin type 3 repeat-containing protein [Nannocystaceae bacterium]|nr:thrombospondin type 3 repeat-containing protein [Nannocystaceae bacterium]